MKRKFTLLTLLCALFAFQGFAQSSKMVMIEEGTQASCGPCATQNPNFDALLDANPDKVVVLKYQTSWPGFDQMNLDNPGEVQDRVDYYAIEGVPTGVINGSYIPNDCQFYDGAPACLSQADIDAAYTSGAAFDLNVNAGFENGMLTVTGKLTANEAVNGDIRLRLALAERTIEYVDVPGGSNGETEFYHVLKKFITGSAGTDLEDSWEAGDDYNINETLDLAGIPIYNYSSMEVVAFVQDDNTKDVFQAAKDGDVTITVAESNNATAFRLSGLPLAVCAGEQSIEPVFTLQNGGNEILTSTDIVYSVNGGSPETYAWAGSLGTLEREDITLPAYTFTTSSNNTLNVTVENPNGVTDEDTSDNTYEVEVPLAAQTSNNIVILELIPDDYGSETTWELRNEAGSLLYEGGPYTDGNSDPIVVEMLLTVDGCYDFEIADTFGDGICCAFGNGSYTLSDGDGATLLQGGEFASSESQPMTLEGGTEVNNNASITAYSGLTDPFCGEVTFAPSLTVQNLGLNEITSIDVEIRNMGTVLDTESWTGSIASGETGEVQLSDIMLSGDSDLSFHITAVNGMEDTYTSGNEYTGVTLPLATAGYATLSMALNTDCWPEENTWVILDEAGDLVVSGGPYNGQAQSAIFEEFTLPADGCYEFVFIDAYGDGLNGEQWSTCGVSGNITLFDELGTTLFEYDGSYNTAEERSIFDYSMVVGVEETIFEEGFTVSPNPTSGNLTLDFAIEAAADATVSIHNMLGAEVMTVDLGTLASGSHIQNIEMGDLASGVYVVRLNADGGSIAKKVVLTR